MKAKTRQKQARKHNYRQISFTNINTQNFNKIFVNGIQQCVRRKIHHDQMEFLIQYLKNSDLVYYINRLRIKTTCSHLIDAYKAFDKNATPNHNKTQQTRGRR